jgi:hypothetical protein
MRNSASKRRKQYPPRFRQGNQQVDRYPPPLHSRPPPLHRRLNLQNLSGSSREVRGVPSYYGRVKLRLAKVYARLPRWRMNYVRRIRAIRIGCLS